MSLYERQGQPKLDDYQDAVLRLTEIYREGWVDVKPQWPSDVELNLKDCQG